MNRLLNKVIETLENNAPVTSLEGTIDEVTVQNDRINLKVYAHFSYDCKGVHYFQEERLPKSSSNHVRVQTSEDYTRLKAVLEAAKQEKQKIILRGKTGSKLFTFDFNVVEYDSMKYYLMKPADSKTNN